VLTRYKFPVILSCPKEKEKINYCLNYPLDFVLAAVFLPKPVRYRLLNVCYLNT